MGNSTWVQFVSSQKQRYLHALHLLFVEHVDFLQRLKLDLHADEPFLHLSSLVLQLQHNLVVLFDLTQL